MWKWTWNYFLLANLCHKIQKRKKLGSSFPEDTIIPKYTMTFVLHQSRARCKTHTLSPSFFIQKFWMYGFYAFYNHEGFTQQCSKQKSNEIIFYVRAWRQQDEKWKFSRLPRWAEIQLRYFSKKRKETSPQRSCAVPIPAGVHTRLGGLWATWPDGGVPCPWEGLELSRL